MSKVVNKMERIITCVSDSNVSSQSKLCNFIRVKYLDVLDHDSTQSSQQKVVFVYR